MNTISCEGCNWKCEMYKDLYTESLKSREIQMRKEKLEACKTFMENCLCRECLIKVICKETCEEFRMYVLTHHPKILENITKVY